MKLRVYIARKYKETDITKVKAENPSYDNLAATAHWVEDKYGTWVNEKMPTAADDFLITTDSTEFFDIDFNQKAHADEFQARVGGQKL